MLTAVVSTGTNVVLIPIWGATGAAVGLADRGVGPDLLLVILSGTCCAAEVGHMCQ